MLKQRKKHLLENFLAVRKRKPEAREIAKQRLPELVEERDYFLLQPLPAITGLSRRCGSQNRQYGGVLRRHAMNPLYCIFRDPSFCSAFLCRQGANRSVATQLLILLDIGQPVQPKPASAFLRSQ